LRGTAKLTWVKLHINGWLHGSIRWQLEADERGVWADLIALAGQCLSGGAISDNDGRPYPRDFIAGQLNIRQELLDRTIAKCRQNGQLVDRDDMIVLTNWKIYQSEYERQKQYRAKPEPTDHQSQLKAASEASTERAKKKLIK